MAQRSKRRKKHLKKQRRQYLRLKIVLLGDAMVGKTTLLGQFSNTSVDDVYEPTVGIDFLNKSTATSEGRKVMLSLWDTAGQERFRSLIPSYVRDADIVLLVYDRSSEESFNSLEFWKSQVDEHRGNAKDELLACVISNKNDLDAVVTDEQGQRLAEQLGAQLFASTSARTGDGVKRAFQRIIDTAARMDDDRKDTKPVKNTVRVSNHAAAKPGCSC